MKREMNRSRKQMGTLFTGLAGAAVLFSAIACESTRRSIVVEHNARDDVAFYERLVDENPEDAFARDRLAQAREQLADGLAWDAEHALSRGRLNEGLRLAREAAKYDSRYADLAEHVSRRVAAVHVRRAEIALDQFDFGSARAELDKATRIAPNYLPVNRFGDRLDNVESEFFTDLAQEYYDAQDFEHALTAISRAEHLQPNDANVITLQMKIERASRGKYISRTADEVRQLVMGGRLDDAELRLETLLEIDPSDLELRALAQRIDDQKAQATSAMIEADNAMDDGSFERAAELLLLAVELDHSVDATPMLLEARGGMARDQMMAAMESGDRLEALLSAREALRFVQDESIERLIPQLETAYVQHVASTVKILLTAKKKDEARAAIVEALDHVQSEELQEIFDSIDE